MAPKSKIIRFSFFVVSFSQKSHGTSTSTAARERRKTGLAAVGEHAGAAAAAQPTTEKTKPPLLETGQLLCEALTYTQLSL
jgi:hypothetical protein